MTDANFQAHEACEDCGSSDAKAVYDDGHTYCFSCQSYTSGDKVTKKKIKNGLISQGDYRDLPARNLKEETLRKFGYFTTNVDGTPAQVAPYYDKDNKVVAQKVRLPGKEFFVTGDLKNATLFGQNLWRKGGKRLVITEGEIDAMSMCQAMNLSWPVVSVPNGATGAAKAIRNSIEFVESYDEVVIMFDNDEPGQKAAMEVSAILTPGKAKVAVLPLKDPNEMLVANRIKELVNAAWEAQEKRPDGIVNGSDLWDAVSKPVDVGIPYPWTDLNKLTFGLRTHELITIAAGSGIGKSAVSAELAYHLAITHQEKVGYVALEESVGRSATRFMSINLDKPIHLPGITATDKEKRKAFDETLGKGNIFFFDHFGSLEPENLLSKMRYLVKGCGCKWVVLDHLSIVVSGLDVADGERRAIDEIMTMLRSFVQETGCGMILVSHLRRPEGRGHEEGAKTSLAQLRGSAAIGQLSDIVIGLERNQQASDPTARNTTVVRVLKNRISGLTGIGAALLYSSETGRLTETEYFEEESDSGSEDF